jgi:hypothetical protein
MTPINPNMDAVNTINEGQQQEGIRLPFPVSYARWVNGEARNKKNADVTYFGGWSISADQYEAQVSLQGNAPLSYMSKTSMTNDAGSDYDAYNSRFIICAEICRRERWIEEKHTSHLQILCQVAEVSPDKKTFSAWGAIVLTAKGWAGINLKKAISDWGALTIAGRRDYANSMPAFMLYGLFGTFGNELKTADVGKTVKHTITPCQFGKPTGEINEALINRYYIGDETLLKMAELSKAAREWQSAWAKDKPVSTYATDESEPEQPPENAIDDMPF